MGRSPRAAPPASPSFYSDGPVEPKGQTHPCRVTEAMLERPAAHTRGSSGSAQIQAPGWRPSVHPPMGVSSEPQPRVQPHQPCTWICSKGISKLKDSLK